MDDRDVGNELVSSTLFCMGIEYLVDNGDYGMVTSVCPYLRNVGSPQIRMGTLGTI